MSFEIYSQTCTFRGLLSNKETVVFEKEKCDLFYTGDNLINVSDIV